MSGFRREFERRRARVRQVAVERGLRGLIELAVRAWRRQAPRAWQSLWSWRGVSLQPASVAGMDGRPSVTVVITSFNRSELLPIALRSLQMQDFTEWECIIVDDASTDDAVAVAQTFVESDARFRLVVHDQRLGVSAARNTGIALATGDYVCLLDDDDFLLAGSLAHRVSAMQGASRDVAGAYCDWINADAGEGLEGFAKHRARRQLGRVSFVSLRKGTPFIASSPLLRRDVLRLADAFDESRTHAEDADLWFRICRLGFVFLPVQHVGVAYRRTSGSVVLSSPRRQLAGLLEVQRRADADAPQVEAIGPAPITDGLSRLAVVADQADQQLPYLALIAVEDVDEAVEAGIGLFPEAVRHGLDVSELTDRLDRYVATRRVGEGPVDPAVRRARIVEFMQRLSEVPIRPWAVDGCRESDAARRDRARVVAPRPVVVDSESLDLRRAVILLVESAYHVDEFGPLYEELTSHGVPAYFMLSPKTVPAAHAGIGRYCRSVVQYDVTVADRAAAIVVLNDWGPVRDLIEAANAMGTPTFAKVEGVQDFDDADTGRTRRAYRTASVILGQGENDVRALPDKEVVVVGSSRLERIWREPDAVRTREVLVNLNFTFNVLTEHRIDWMDSVRTAIEVVGLPGLVSAHPAERSRDLGLPFATKPFRHEITRCGALVSRFSTVPFEAMARGIPFVYHNPHGERVPTFADPRGAFLVSRSADELADALASIVSAPEEWQSDRWADFFRAQVDIDDGRSPAERACAAILSRVG